MWRLGWVLGLALVLLTARAGAENTPRWKLGPPLELGAATLPLADGQLLTCDGEGALPCALLDPLSGERQAVPGNVDLVRSGVALDSGQVFVHLRQPLLLDPETGATRELPRPPRDLTQLQSAPLFRGRLAFWSNQKAVCHELLLWLGEQRGFQLLSAGPAGHCVHEIFDLGDGRVLVAVEVPAKQRNRAGQLKFRLLDLTAWRWRDGATLPWAQPIAAFVYRDGILVLAHHHYRRKGDLRETEVLLLDDKAALRARRKFPRGSSWIRAYRWSEREILRVTGEGADLWNLEEGALLPLPNPYEAPEYPVFLGMRRQHFLQVGPLHTLVLERNAPRPQTPCDDLFVYTQRMLEADKALPSIDRQRIAELMRGYARGACHDFIEQSGRFPDHLQGPLDALERLGKAPSELQQQGAATVLCTVIPNWGYDSIRRLASQVPKDTPDPGPHGWRETCAAAAAELPVLQAAAEGKPAWDALVEAALDPREPLDRPRLARWVMPLLRARADLRQQAGPLLLVSAERKALGYDGLRALLCEDYPSKELESACDDTEADQERGWTPAPHRAWLLGKFAIATGALAGIGALGYVTREDPSGRALATTVGAVGGAAVAASMVFLAFDSPQGPPIHGLFMIPAAILGGIAGGVAAYYASETPGTPRFVTVMVPVSLAWLTGLGLVADAW